MFICYAIISLSLQFKNRHLGILDKFKISKELDKKGKLKILYLKLLTNGLRGTSLQSKGILC